VSALEIAGFAAVPANALPAARVVALKVAGRNGGDGAVREVMDEILANAYPIGKAGA
jgi:3-deoxy-D-manno-octulosonate 8-phosphate phosphatase KdsC-like HAD superfamily phosphatase